jgi:Transposase DDE domain
MDAKQAKNRCLRPHAKSFLDSIRELLPPAMWKQAKKARGCNRRFPRWDTQPLILTLLVMTWCCGDSQSERFETAKGFAAVCLAKRRRPGDSVQGFQKALAKLPMHVLRAVAAGVRRRLLKLLDLKSDGFNVFGCDGSSMETPRVAELERRLDPPVKQHGRPQVWVTALVHLQTGLLWSWRLGKGYNRERDHLRALLPTLPAAALVVADAGFNGYDLACTITGAGISFLIRMSGKDRLYTEKQIEVKGFQEGEVLLWTQDAKKDNLAPLRVRLIRIRGTKKRRDVWLLTNVLDAKRLTVEMAGRYYRWRWENEGLFRTFKRTLSKVRLMSRTVRLVHREAEGALLATQLLLAQGVLAMGPGTSTRTPQRCSPRKILLVIRDVILGKIGIRKKEALRKRLDKSLRDDRQRTSAKVTRKWPRRANHKVQKPPRFLMLAEHEKALARQLLGAAA